MEPIAVVGLACRYPDAPDPAAFWENILAQRRAFRRIPDERLPLDEYGGERDEPDVTYGASAAVLTDWEFDRVKFRVAARTYRTVDPSHWLALECAARALDDAGFANASGLPAQTTGVIIGNTLTGDYSRAAALRLRWPYVRRILQEVLDRRSEDTIALLDEVEEHFKAPLPEVNEETLAGWLSNTIAGRICNHFDLGGGGFVVDGACSSSLIAVATACDALRTGAMDVALAGGVDLSLDPFELVGFAKAGALADGEMLVYDRRARGFAPGEGCGFAVLMRATDARARGARIYALVRGWGLSSDGHGGITRPEPAGQLRALERAYASAGFGVDTVGYFEGHGTGTPVGDAVEIAMLSSARRRTRAERPAAIGSVKANIGHTKAAAGIAGFIKTTLALHHQIIPPTTACSSPHPRLADEPVTLQVERSGRLWPSHTPLRAGVSSMGFGGINVHVALEGVADERRDALTDRERRCLRSAQDAEVIPLAAPDPAALLADARELARAAPRLSRAELTDLAVSVQRSHTTAPCRAAVVAGSTKEFVAALHELVHRLEDGRIHACDPAAGVFAGYVARRPRVVFLFPGQASPSHPDGGVWRRRFAAVADLYDGVDLPREAAVDTAVAQPAIVRASLAGLRVLRMLHIEAATAVGHSLGEFCALHWAGVISEGDLTAIASYRGSCMAMHAVAGGGMASVAATAEAVVPHLPGSDVVIAGFNSPHQTVISGPLPALRRACASLRAAGLTVHELPVSHAFHSPAMAPASGSFRDALQQCALSMPTKAVISTVTGRRLAPCDDVRELLVAQLTTPVHFVDALREAAEGADLFIEVGPGTVLTGLADVSGCGPVIALDSGSESLRGLLNTAAAAHVMGVDVDWTALADDRFARRIDLARPPRVLVNPCEAGATPTRRVPRRPAAETTSEPSVVMPSARGDSPEQIARRIVAARADLPLDAVEPQHRLLSDLHLNSLTASQVLSDLAHALSVSAPSNPTEFADATVAELTSALIHVRGMQPVERSRPAGVAPWVRVFRSMETPAAVLQVPSGNPESSGEWRVNGADDDPLVIELRRVVVGAPGEGIISCLAPDPQPDDVLRLLADARDATARSGRFVVVQRGSGGAAVARCAWMEAPQKDVALIDVVGAVHDVGRQVLDEALDARGFSHVILRDGGRMTPRIAVMTPEAADTPALDERDVVLFTGGGKGIAAECALALAIHTGARIGIIGRSSPEDEALVRMRERFTDAGVMSYYAQADVSDSPAVSRAVTDIERALGPITAFVHAAGVNEPRLLRDLDEPLVRATLAIKVAGLEHVLSALKPDNLRLGVAFGSLTTRAGVRGDAHYAAANELMIARLERWGAAHPHCRCLGLEWSVWAGIGMGERLGTLTALEQSGVAPLTVDQGTAVFCDLVQAENARGTLIVSGRFPATATIQSIGEELPLLRFLERPLVWVPGVELVVEADISPASDLYLDDHLVGGDRVLPGVLGFEAMAQVAAPLSSTAGVVVEFADVKFNRPIVVPRERPRRIRLAALRGLETEAIDVVVRSDETEYATDHFRARVTFRESRDFATAPVTPPNDVADALTACDASSFYGDLLFQSGRFRRVDAYSTLRAFGCVATLRRANEAAWFSEFHPATLLLGDPGARDAAIHAVQACVPDARLLPVSIDRLTIAAGGAARKVRAAEREHRGTVFVYDLEVTDDEGFLVERWEGLRLGRLEPVRPRAGWPPALLSSLIERACVEVGGLAWARVLLIPFDSSTDGSGRAAAAAAFGTPLRMRPDGRPVPGAAHADLVSISHDAGRLLAIQAHAARLACDLQAVVTRTASEWSDLLGLTRAQLAQWVSTTLREDYSCAAARVWSAGECLKKAGLPADAPLVAAHVADDWAVFACDAARVLTRVLTGSGACVPVVVAVLAEPHAAGAAPLLPHALASATEARV